MNRTMEDIQWRVASDDPLSAAWDREDALGRMLEEARETITRLTKQHDEWSDEAKRLREQYTELREALVGDSPNWTHEELIEKALELIK